MRETFYIVVEVLNRKDEKTAIATAASYLAYGDQTDTIGYAPSYNNVNVFSDASAPVRIGFEIEVNIENDDHLKNFMDEMEQLSRTMSVERVE